MATEQTPGAPEGDAGIPPAPQAPVAAPMAGTTASTEPRPAEVPAAAAEALAAPVQAVAESAAAAAPPAKKGLMAAITGNPRRSIGIGAILLGLAIGFVWPAVPAPHVALGGEPVSIHWPQWLTNSMLHTLIVDAILILVALLVRARLKLIPTGLQNFIEMVLEYFYGLAEQIAGKSARTYFPWIMTIFLFVIVSNWTGFTPGVGSIGFEQTHGHSEEEGATEEHSSRFAGQLAMADGNLVLLSGAEVAVQAEEGESHFVPLLRAPTADLNVTFALAIVTMFMVQFWGIRALGGSYFRKFFNFSGNGMMRGINGFVGILELISEISRILSFGFRLFGNIFAGEIVLATMAFLGAFLLPLPFYILETFVGFVQALVFTMLALVFFSMATVGHHDHEEGHAEAH